MAENTKDGGPEKDAWRILQRSPDDTPTTEPDDWTQNPYFQTFGGFIGGLGLGIVPFAGAGEQILEGGGVLGHGTPAAQRGLAVGQVVGGISLPEERVPTPGGSKMSRRPDITTRAPDGSVYRENGGRSTSDGSPRLTRAASP